LRTGKITLSIESQFDNVFLIGLAINRIASSIPVSEQAAFEMELAVVEAVNNAIEHAHDHQRNRQITVRLQLRSDFVQFQIIDRGAPIDFDAAMAASPNLESAGELERGRGLSIIRALMDEVRYERRHESNHITLVKYLNRS
jgi:serine/threonine-protein kinase RsbW